MMSAGKIVLGVLAGAAAGAILGVLFAPDKGSVTRGKISKKGGDLTETLKDKFSEFLDSLTGTFEAMQDEVDNLSEMRKPDSVETEEEAGPEKA